MKISNKCGCVDEKSGDSIFCNPLIRYKVDVFTLHKYPKKYLADALRNQTYNDYQKYSTASSSYNIFLTKVGILLAVASAVIALIYSNEDYNLKSTLSVFSVGLLVICCIVGMTILITCNHNMKTIKSTISSIEYSQNDSYAGLAVNLNDLYCLLNVSGPLYKVMCAALSVALIFIGLIYFIPADYVLHFNAYVVIGFILICIHAIHKTLSLKKICDIFEKKYYCVLMTFFVALVSVYLMGHLSSIEVNLIAIILVLGVMIFFGHKIDYGRRCLMCDGYIDVSRHLQEFGVHDLAKILAEKVRKTSIKHDYCFIKSKYPCYHVQATLIIANRHAVQRNYDLSRKMLKSVDDEIKSLGRNKKLHQFSCIAMFATTLDYIILDVMEYKSDPSSRIDITKNIQLLVKQIDVSRIYDEIRDSKQKNYSPESVIQNYIAISRMIEQFIPFLCQPDILDNNDDLRNEFKDLLYLLYEFENKINKRMKCMCDLCIDSESRFDMLQEIDSHHTSIERSMILYKKYVAYRQSTNSVFNYSSIEEDISQFENMNLTANKIAENSYYCGCIGFLMGDAGYYDYARKAFLYFKENYGSYHDSAVLSAILVRGYNVNFDIEDNNSMIGKEFEYTAMMVDETIYQSFLLINKKYIDKVKSKKENNKNKKKNKNKSTSVFKGNTYLWNEPLSYLVLEKILGGR